jgi:hypothetical protein
MAAHAWQQKRTLTQRVERSGAEWLRVAQSTMNDSQSAGVSGRPESDATARAAGMDVNINIEVAHDRSWLNPSADLAFL